MPIYEYACQKCRHEFDALQKVSDGPLKKCPECGALRLKRLISAPSFHLKGTGWYETDFKKDGKRKPADGGDDTPAGDAQKGAQKVVEAGDKKDSAATESKTDAKPESKAETKTPNKDQHKNGKGKDDKPPKPPPPAAD